MTKVLRLFPGQCDAPSLPVYPGEGVVLVAMNNPMSPDPRLALFPAPSGVAGHRLLEMLRAAAREEREDWEISERQYLRAFDRVNLLDATVWRPMRARERAPQVRERLRGRDLIVLGREPPKILGMRMRDWGVWFHWWADGDESKRPSRVCLLPHPSGRCREYNDAGVRRLAGRVLLSQYRRVRPGG